MNGVEMLIVPPSPAFIQDIEEGALVGGRMVWGSVARALMRGATPLMATLGECCP